MRFASIATLLVVLACKQGDVNVARHPAGGNSIASGAPIVGQLKVDTVASAWLARARAMPEIASWLYLRAATATADSGARRVLYARVTLPLARERIPWTEAAALEKFGDTTGALRAYKRLPAPITVLRLRAIATPGARDSVRRELVALIVSVPSANSVREATAVFDDAFRHQTLSEQLSIARASVAVGAWSRARGGFSSVPLAKLGSQDRFSYAQALSHLDEDRKAASMYASVKAPARLALPARYQRARSLLAAGEVSAARAVLGSLSRTARDTSAAAALVLLADLDTDADNDSMARKTLLAVVSRFPATRFAAPARFDAALIALILGDATMAAREFETLATAAPEFALASRYWAGRAQLASGDTVAAGQSWTEVLRRDSTSYYASLAATRLGVRSMHATSATTQYPHVPAVDSAVRRVALLDRLGLSPEARFENGRLFSNAMADTARLLATAAAFSGTDQAARAIALGRRALPLFGSTPAIWRLIYPIAARDTIVRESRSAGLDPAFVAALIRQESNFNPAARSPAGARGLMQVMPAVGKSIAPSAGIRSWNPNLLYDPGINIELGIRHLAPLIRSQPNLPRALAAYNAGESRVVRWSRKKGAEDAEVFTERIPFTETREYVKSVLRNREFYRALYEW